MTTVHLEQLFESVGDILGETCFATCFPFTFCGKEEKKGVKERMMAFPTKVYFVI